MKLFFWQKEKRAWCAKCNTLKPASEYVKKRNDCKECRSNYHSLSRYGIDNNELKKLLYQQDNKCAICLQSLKKRSECHVDHDHQTKVIRGILCRNCNTALGLLRDNYENFERGSKYLKKYQYSNGGYYLNNEINQLSNKILKNGFSKMLDRSLWNVYNESKLRREDYQATDAFLYMFTKDNLFRLENENIGFRKYWKESFSIFYLQKMRKNE